jgi:hypothetical protein
MKFTSSKRVLFILLLRLQSPVSILSSVIKTGQKKKLHMIIETVILPAAIAMVQTMISETCTQ